MIFAGSSHIVAVDGVLTHRAWQRDLRPMSHLSSNWIGWKVAADDGCIERDHCADRRPMLQALVQTPRRVFLARRISMNKARFVSWQQLSMSPALYHICNGSSMYTAVEISVKAGSGKQALSGIGYLQRIS